MTETVRRNRYGQYEIVPPGGGKPVGYMRATSLAEVPSDKNGIKVWFGAMAALGFMHRPGLMAQLETLISQYGPNPWYASPDAKKQLKRLIDEAAEAGGSADRSQAGTAMHSLVETLNKGGTPLVSQESTQRDLDAYRYALDAAGIVVNPDYCERIVVLDEFGVAGMPDMLSVEVPGFDQPLCADLKTGQTLDYSWQSICTQMGLYVNADNLYTQGAAADGSEDYREAMPEVSHTHGLVIHLPAGEGRCDLYINDLVAGWEGAKVAVEVRKLRQRRNLATLLPASTPTPPAPKTPKRSPLSMPGDPIEPVDDFDLPKVKPLTTAAPVEQRQELRKRPDEGPDCDPAAAEALNVRFKAMSQDALTLYSHLAIDAQRAGLSWYMSERRSVRRFEIIRALVALCSNPDVTAEEIRGLVAAAMDNDAPLFPAVTVGHGIGALDATEAALFARLADAHLSDQGLPAVIDEHGVLRFDRSAIAA
jgi:hypothetical protein